MDLFMKNNGWATGTCITVLETKIVSESPTRSLLPTHYLGQGSAAFAIKKAILPLTQKKSAWGCIKSVNWPIKVINRPL